MKISYNWLKEYFEALPSPDVIAGKLTMAGLEVEGVEAPGRGIQGIFVARVLSVEKHPNADRLSFCKVETDKGVHPIVCGAKNMKAGDKVALALPGAMLPKGIKIEKTRIRGIESEGMMCSEVELGLKDTSEGIMILPQDLPIGMEFTKALGLDDVLLNINVTPNRPDCLSILGIAREISAIVKAELKEPEINVAERGKAIKKLASVSIEEPSLCRRYAARVIEGIKVGPSPEWLKQRLESLGFRSINNVVDVTNYVMIEYGHPMHAFDYDLISDRKIIVRKATQDEKIQTLDGAVRVLAADMLVIADAERPVALAGIMGGKESEIGDATVNILLESAYFDPLCVRRTSKALGISTESSYRFERGADIEGVTRALDKACQMINELAGGDIAKGTIDKYPGPYKPAAIQARHSRINKILGIDINKEDVEDYLKRLNMVFKKARAQKKGDTTWNVTPPSYRVDILREIDIIEEIARIHGYEAIPAKLPAAGLSAAKTKAQDFIVEGVRDILTNNGFLEAINYSFISRKFSEIAPAAGDGLRLLNPLTEEQSIMRESLASALLQTLEYNINHNNRDIKVFETGRVFIKKGAETEERGMIGGLMSGLRYGEAWNSGRDAVDFYDIKGAVENILNGLGIETYIFTQKNDIPLLHPGKGAAIEAAGKRIGIVGEIHPDVMQRLDIKQPAYFFELDMQSMIQAISGGLKKYTPLPKYPMIARDAALIVDRGIMFREIYDAIKGMGVKPLEDVGVFDVYYGKNIPENKLSMALRFTYRSQERTLTDEEVNSAHSAILENLKNKFRIEIRGEEG